MPDVHSLWIGDRLSALELLSVASHLKQGHRYHLWCYKSYDNLPDGVIVEDANAVLPEKEIFCYKIGIGAGSVSAFSNIFRYKLISERGGWWSDCDVVALKSFPEVDHMFASERHPDGSSLPTTCAFTGRDVAAECYKKAVLYNRNTLVWGRIGPRLFSSTIRNMGLEEFTASPDDFCPVDWFEPFKRPKATPGHAVHLWHEMWRRNKKDKDSWVAGTLYHDLLERFLPDAVLRKS